MSELINDSMTIAEALEKMRKYEFVIPVFQRKYRWEIDKIESLWDSILQGFPISTFLLWEINSDNVTSDTAFYRALQEVEYKKGYDGIERTLGTYTGIEDIAILDGQQRLNSLYLSLLGSIKIYKDSNVTSQTLIIELDETKIFDDDMEESASRQSRKKFNKKEVVWKKKYDIHFTGAKVLTSTEFKVREIWDNQDFRNKKKRGKAIQEAISNVSEKSKEYARSLLENLCCKVFDEKLVNYTLAKGMKQEDALEMFVRFNSGGERLTKAEITSSILQVYWKYAESSFDKLLTGAYEGFDYDFIIRSAHLLWGDVVKSNISHDVVTKLKNEWGIFCQTLDKLKNLLKDKLHIEVSYFAKRWNVLLPIIYEIYNNPSYEEDAPAIRAYLARAVLFGYFRNATTGKLSKLSKRIKNQMYKIILADLDDEADLRVTKDKVENILDVEYRNKISGDALYFLSLKWNQGFDYAKDHMHPQKSFSGDIINVDPQTKDEWLKLYNKLPNLQYLNKSTNERKNGRPLEDWLSTEEEQARIREQAYIPENVPLDIQHFGEFYKARKELLRTKLEDLLNGKEEKNE